MALSKAEKRVKALEKLCDQCENSGPACWDCEVQSEIDQLTDFVIFAEKMALQGFKPDGTPLK